MRSNFRGQGGARRQDARRFTTVEISESAHPPAINPRKRLHSAEEVQCGSRPNPEGAGGSVSVTELSHFQNKHGRENLCQRCQVIANDLNRQALELAEPGTLKDPSFAAFLHEKLQTLEWPPRGFGAQIICEVCGTSLHYLRRLALHSALGLILDDMPDLHPGPLSGLLPPRAASHIAISSHNSWQWPTQGSLPSSSQQPCAPLHGEKQQKQGWNQDGASRVGGKRSCLVTPLPLHPQHYLEGVWRVTRASDHILSLGHAAESESLGGRATEASRSHQPRSASSVSSSGRKPSHQDQPALPPAPQTSLAASFLLRILIPYHSPLAPAQPLTPKTLESSIASGSRSSAFSAPVETAEILKAVQPNVLKCHRSMLGLSSLRECRIQMAEVCARLNRARVLRDNG